MKIYTVNFHLEERCNLKCLFCYARFAELRKKVTLSFEESIHLITSLKEAGCLKINFAGGEPFLHAHLGELIQHAHQIGLKTSVVTNGTRLKEDWLMEYGSYLDWIAISCDSADEQTQKLLGRGKGEQADLVEKAFAMIKRFNQKNAHQIRTKLNSVITRLNWEEDMNEFVQRCGVERWKIFQVLYIEGENDDTYPDLAINCEQFEAFVQRHLSLEKKGIVIADEDNDAMTESYVMVDPQGRFYQNSEGSYIKSDLILKVGVEKALLQVGFSEKKFLQRGGLYEF